MPRRAPRFAHNTKHGQAYTGDYYVAPRRDSGVKTTSIPCPDCLAVAGQRCLLSGGNHHASRKRLATRAWNAANEAWTTYAENVASTQAREEAELLAGGQHGRCSSCNVILRLVIDPAVPTHLRADAPKVTPRHPSGEARPTSRTRYVPCLGSGKLPKEES